MLAMVGRVWVGQQGKCRPGRDRLSRGDSVPMPALLCLQHDLPPQPHLGPSAELDDGSFRAGPAPGLRPSSGLHSLCLLRTLQLPRPRGCSARGSQADGGRGAVCAVLPRVHSFLAGVTVVHPSLLSAPQDSAMVTLEEKLALGNTSEMQRSEHGLSMPQEPNCVPELIHARE